MYISDNGMCMLIWIGMNVSPDWVVSLFGVQSVAQIDIDMVSTMFKLLFTSGVLVLRI
jgi:hypothetical protein